MKFSVVSRLAHKKLASKGSRKKAKCQAAFCEYFARQTISRGTYETLNLEDFKCDFLTFHLYHIYPHYSKSKGGY